MIGQKIKFKNEIENIDLTNKTGIIIKIKPDIWVKKIFYIKVMEKLFPLVSGMYEDNVVSATFEDFIILK